jgi:hypothetical protein
LVHVWWVPCFVVRVVRGCRRLTGACWGLGGSGPGSAGALRPGSEA